MNGHGENRQHHTALDRHAGTMRFSCALLSAMIGLQIPAAYAVAPEGYQVVQSVDVHGSCDCIIELIRLD